MSLSTPPPPTPSTTNTPTIIPLFPPHPPHPPPYQLPPKPNNLLYPLPNKPTPPNHPYSSRPAIWFPNPGPLFAYDNRPSMYNPSAQLPPALGFIASPHHLQKIGAGPSSGGVVSGVVKGLPIAKMGSNQTPTTDNNGFKEARDRSRDDSFLIIRDRKVRVSEDSSLYALCRSWLRNGLPEETEPQYIDVVKSLPRPLPLAPQDSQFSGKKEEKEEQEEEDGGFVEHLTPQDLLQKHIKRAKRVRSRLREERLRRIARYKTRLSLLLPPIVEQHYRNESTAGNGNTS